MSEHNEFDQAQNHLDNEIESQKNRVDSQQADSPLPQASESNTTKKKTPSINFGKPKLKTIITIIAIFISVIAISSAMSFLVFRAKFADIRGTLIDDTNLVFSELSTKHDKFLADYNDFKITVNNNPKLENLNILVNDYRSEVTEVKSTLQGVRRVVNSTDTQQKSQTISIDQFRIAIDDHEKRIEAFESFLVKYNNLKEITKIQKRNKTAPIKIKTTKPIVKKPTKNLSLDGYNFTSIDVWGNENVLVLTDGNDFQRLRIGNVLETKTGMWKLVSITRSTNTAEFTNGKKSLLIGK